MALPQSLRSRLPQWRKLPGASHPICKRIEQGAHIRLFRAPVQQFRRQRQPTADDAAAIQASLSKFCEEGVLVPTKEDDIDLFSPTYVLWRDRAAQGLPPKARLIFNCKASGLNAAIRDEGRFSLPGFAAIRATFWPTPTTVP